MLKQLPTDIRTERDWKFRDCRGESVSRLVKNCTDFRRIGRTAVRIIWFVAADIGIVGQDIQKSTDSAEILSNLGVAVEYNFKWFTLNLRGF